MNPMIIRPKDVVIILYVMLFFRRVQFRLKIESHGHAHRVDHIIVMTMGSGDQRYRIGSIFFASNEATVLSITGRSAVIGPSQNLVEFVVFLCGIGNDWFTIKWVGTGPDNVDWSISNASVKMDDGGGWTVAEYSLRRVFHI